MAGYANLVYPICCGMDVHKSFIVVCVAVTDLQHPALEPKLFMHRFSTFTGDLRRLADWLDYHKCRDVCMESTGSCKYFRASPQKWIPVFNILEQRGFNVCLTHPKYVKAIKGKKTDKRDARWIANLFRFDQVRASFIPPPTIRQLRDLCRYHGKLTNVNTAEKNRAQNCLTVCNFKLDEVFSDVFGQSATRVLNALLEHRNSNFDIAPLLDKHCKASVEDVRAALDGELTLAQAEKLKLIRSHKASIDNLKSSLETLILDLAAPYDLEIAFLQTVPGIGSELTAIRVLAEIGADMSVFETAKHLISWAGLCPQNNESGGKRKTTRIARAGQYLKPLLVEISLAAVKSKDFPEIGQKYQSLKHRRGGKKAIIAIARKLLTAIWHILSKQTVYDGELYCKADKLPKNRELTQAQAFDLLRSQGYVIKNHATSPPDVDLELTA